MAAVGPATHLREHPFREGRKLLSGATHHPYVRPAPGGGKGRSTNPGSIGVPLPPPEGTGGAAAGAGGPDERPWPVRAIHHT